MTLDIFRFATAAVGSIFMLAYSFIGVLATAAWLDAAFESKEDKAGGWGWGMTASWAVVVVGIVMLKWAIFQ